ncbi:MAG: TolA-binding protein [Verrucomicrobiales bacterium]|jgi:TolA-binding protein
MMTKNRKEKTAALDPDNDYFQDGRFSGIVFTTVVSGFLLLGSEAIGQSEDENQQSQSATATTTKPSFLRRLFKDREDVVLPESKVESQQDGDDLFDYAGVLYQKKFFDLARDKYQKYVSEFPAGQHLETVNYRIAECQLRNDLKAAAIVSYKALIKDFPEGDYVAPSAYRVAGLIYNAERYEEAAPFFALAAANAKQENLKVGSLYHQARCQELSDQSAEATKTFGQVLAEHPQSEFAARAAIGLGNLALAQKKIDDALAHYEFAIAFDFESSGKQQSGRKGAHAAIVREAQFGKAICLKEASASKEAEARKILHDLIIDIANDDEWRAKALETQKAWGK